MINEMEYVELMHRIVAAVLPEEVAAFELSGPHVARQLFAGESPGSGAASAGEFQFIDNVADVLKFVGLMIGTLEGIWKISDRLKKLRKVDSEDALAAQWKRHLLQHGVDDAVASEAVSRFRADILALVRRNG
jgi:hypothetical protein